jgi:hypothetical protein
MSGDPSPAGADEDVVVTSGDVTSISDSASGADAVASGGSAIAASLTADGDVLNIAFVTGGGDVQFVQIKVADLIPGGGASGADVVVSAELTALSGDVISSGGGEATPMGTIAVAANLDRAGDLTLSFSDGNGDVQLIETNVGELLQDGLASGSTGAAPPVEPGSTGAGR